MIVFFITNLMHKFFT